MYTYLYCKQSPVQQQLLNMSMQRCYLAQHYIAPADMQEMISQQLWASNDLDLVD